ncbi:MAG: LamG domain-containing protein [Planctomycetes bacterium]|jgi:hypothetical protein|nr:LamG domain-containing protein [Planctomycetota bacterium]
MRHITAAVSLFTSLVTAQDFLHYKFDSACTTEVINYATGPQAFAGNGTLQSNSTLSPFDTGAFGGCLAGGANVAPTYYNRVVSGWDPSAQPLTGDLTMAWFMRLRSGATVGTGLNYLLGAPSGGFRLFTNGVAGTGLLQREVLVSGGNSGARDFQLPAAATNVQALAAAGWVHLAMVVDSTAQTADWYVNGSSVLQLTGVPGAQISLAGPFTIGAYSVAATGAGSAYDIDEFLLSKRAYTAGEVLAMSLAPRAGDGDYTSGVVSQCGAGNVVLGSVGGAPSLGNPGYGLQVTSATPSLFLLLAGLDRCTFGGSVPLPLDGTPLLPLLNGCFIVTDAPVIVNGVTAAGPSVVPFAIAPGAPIGTVVYTQALGLELATLASSMSNGFATAVGN